MSRAISTQKKAIRSRAERAKPEAEEGVIDSQVDDQGELGGRCGTRTHDLSRVKARSARTLTSHRTRKTRNQARIRHQTALAALHRQSVSGPVSGHGVTAVEAGTALIPGCSEIPPPRIRRCLSIRPRHWT